MPNDQDIRARARKRLKGPAPEPQPSYLRRGTLFRKPRDYESLLDIVNGTPAVVSTSRMLTNGS
jgi:hypothetical protein